MVEKKWGILCETSEEAAKVNEGESSGLVRTGLDEYLNVIFPEVNDWQHRESVRIMNAEQNELRPAYLSKMLNLVVEFDGVSHYTSSYSIQEDVTQTDAYIKAGYKVVRIPFFIQLTNQAVRKFFDVEVGQTLFDGRNPSFNLEECCTPAFLCRDGIVRMAKEFRDFPEQYKTNVDYLHSLNNELWTNVETLKFFYKNGDDEKTEEKLEKKIKSDIVRNQHFVPRCYLEAWVNETKRLEWVEKESGRCEPSTVEGVAFQCFFYKNSLLSEKQMEFIKSIYIDGANEKLKDVLMRLLSLFAEKDLYLSFCEKMGWNALASWYEKNTEEKMFAEIESNIPEWRKNIVSFEPAYWKNDDNRMHFILWIMLQYVRTPKMQKKYLQVVEKSKFSELAKNTQNVHRWLSAATLAYSIIASSDMKIVVLKNTTEISFVTSDQPVINIRAIGKEPAQLKDDDMEFYYPFSPFFAILISPDDCYRQWQIVDLNVEAVKRYNDFEKQEAERFFYKCL